MDNDQAGKGTLQKIMESDQLGEIYSFYTCENGGKTH